MRAGPCMGGIVVAVALTAGAPNVAAQHMLEMRVADTEYRFVDWNYTWEGGAVVDVFYVGVPGSNELNVGGGYAVKLGPLTLTPLAYGVAGKEGGQRGVKIALLASFDRSGWKLVSFAAGYLRVSGEVGDYQVLDTLDLTRTIAARWELGVQSGFFHADGAWNTQVGPLLKLTDRWGAWAASYRFGDENEFRVGRVFLF